MSWLEVLVVAIPGLPAAACLLLGAACAVGRTPGERGIARLTAAASTGGLLAALGVALGLALRGEAQLEVGLGRWFGVEGYGFEVKLLADALGLAFATVSAALLGVVGLFAAPYLHREPGFARFFFLLLVFASGVATTTLAGTIDLLFVGWELVGISSALLIAFFRERRDPQRNALRTFAVYRLCDAGLLAAAVLLHHVVHTADLRAAFGAGPWPAGPAGLEGPVATLLAGLLVLAALGKSAQVPFSGWLPRAMDGPTPSSAIFYGALSVHLGVYLLLRAGPLLERAPLASWALVAIGLASALHGTFVGRVQTDAKSALAYATITQVGLILAEIGLGLRGVPLVHALGHACLRTLQLLRAPSLLREHHQVEASLGVGSAPVAVGLEQLLPRPARAWFYRLALERGHHDALLVRVLVEPLLDLARRLDRFERAWLASLGGAEDAPAAEAPRHERALPLGVGAPSCEPAEGSP